MKVSFSLENFAAGIIGQEKIEKIMDLHFPLSINWLNTN